MREVPDPEPSCGMILGRAMRTGGQGLKHDGLAPLTDLIKGHLGWFLGWTAVAVVAGLWLGAVLVAQRRYEGAKARVAQAVDSSRRETTPPSPDMLTWLFKNREALRDIGQDPTVQEVLRATSQGRSSVLDETARSDLLSMWQELKPLGHEEASNQDSGTIESLNAWDWLPLCRILVAMSLAHMETGDYPQSLQCLERAWSLLEIPQCRSCVFGLGGVFARAVPEMSTVLEALLSTSNCVVDAQGLIPVLRRVRSAEVTLASIDQSWSGWSRDYPGEAPPSWGMDLQWQRQADGVLQILLRPSKVFKSSAQLDALTAMIPHLSDSASFSQAQTASKILGPRSAMAGLYWAERCSEWALDAQMTCIEACLTLIQTRACRKTDQIEGSVANLLKALPADPFTGNPCSFMIDQDRITVYSWGGDGVDDGGMMRSQFGPDIAFSVKVSCVAEGA